MGNGGKNKDDVARCRSLFLVTELFLAGTYFHENAKILDKIMTDDYLAMTFGMIFQ